jgi:hypothetical protein
LPEDNVPTDVRLGQNMMQAAHTVCLQLLLKMELVVTVNIVKARFRYRPGYTYLEVTPVWVEPGGGEEMSTDAALDNWVAVPYTWQVAPDHMGLEMFEEFCENAKRKILRLVADKLESHCHALRSKEKACLDAVVELDK